MIISFSRLFDNTTNKTSINHNYLGKQTTWHFIYCNRFNRCFGVFSNSNFHLHFLCFLPFYALFINESSLCPDWNPLFFRFKNYQVQHKLRLKQFFPFLFTSFSTTHQVASSLYFIFSHVTIKPSHFRTVVLSNPAWIKLNHETIMMPIADI